MRSSLADLQRGLLAAITSGEESAFAAQVRAGALTGEQRLATYRRQVFANWRSALAETYPVVERLVGPAFFGEAARRYALAQPSASGDLHRFGIAFAEFLAGYGPAGDLPYLPDVARLEWAWHEAFHAAGAPPFDLAALARIDPQEHPAIHFHLHPAARLLGSEYPIAAIWEANQPERDGTPERAQGPDWVLVHRPELAVHVARLEEDEWRLLAALAAGATLDGAVAALGAAAQERLGSALRRFVALGVISGFST